ncbi:MAG TPA: tetratricopeptide repeat protein, partial [Bryobacteraceae bacterium]|nr:tetratricopeptide repeat protein [Bryobacteraceae bacterium]
PYHQPALYNKAVSLEKLGRAREAILVYQDILAINPEEEGSLGWDYQGLALQQLGKPELALTAYERALAIDARDADIWSHKGDSLCDLGRFADAIVAFDRALQITPNHGQAWQGKGECLAQLQRTEEAVAAFWRALESDPNDVPTLYDLPYCSWEVGRIRSPNACSSVHRRLSQRTAVFMPSRLLRCAIAGAHQPLWRS